jgi:hypothetical protein
MKQIIFIASSLFIVTLSLQSTAQPQTLGLFSRTSASQDGYVLFTPMTSDNTYLIDKCGKSVHTWNGSRKPGASVYLLEDGSLLRAEGVGNTNFAVGGTGGAIVRYDWNGSILWNYTISSDFECQHHDVCRLPNGNILTIVWDRKLPSEAKDAGRDPAHLGTELWSEKIVELMPLGTTDALVVWEWHVWDHLVQNIDASKPNYGAVIDNPGLIDINYYGNNAPGVTDWLHINGIDYNPALDQIMLSVHAFSEIWIIDHSTSSAVAAAHGGGRYGHGGDLLYRWGNPAAYKRGTATDQKLFGQHNARWIKAPRPDSGKIMIFNNGLYRPSQTYSSVDVINPPLLTGNGGYLLNGSSPYGPQTLYWQYQPPTSVHLYSAYMSGAQPLSNRNTLLCEGDNGRFIEVDTAGNIVWEYVNPIAVGPLNQGSNPNGMNNVFRCTQYPATYSGFAGRTLTPGAPLELSPLTYTCKMGSSGGGTNGVSSLAENGQGIVAINPFDDDLTLQSRQSVRGAALQLTDITGRVCQSWASVNFSAAGTIRLNIAQPLPPGVYLLHIASPDYDQVIKLKH